MKTKTSLLLHPLFILSISLLLVNDFSLKYQYHNWLTGKLSDFAGLFAISIFFFSIFPKYKKEIIITVALFFIWWKSPLSNSFIIFCDNRLSLPITRIIDFSDLYALALLPFSLLIKPINYSETFTKKIAIEIICVTSFTAFTATSLPRRLTYDNKVLLDKHLKTKNKEAQVIKALEDHGLGPIKKEPVFQQTWNNDYYLRSKAVDSIMIPADSLYNGVYHRIDDDAGYIILKLYIAKDSIYNLQFIISEHPHGKTDIRLYSFQYNRMHADSAYFIGYDAWKKFKKPIKKKIKEILKQ